jgi:hypothetical protein
MYVPHWIFWVIGIAGTLALSAYVGRSRGDYDFISPLFGLGVLLIGAALALGYWLGG